MNLILHREEIESLEKKAINSGQPVELLMERAGKGIASFVMHFTEENKFPKKVLILAGKGNNAGDGYCAGKLLLKEGFSVVACEVMHPEKGTLCEKKKQEFTKAGGLFVTHIEEEFPCVILDAIFGTGFRDSTSMDESTKACIQLVNRSKLPIISVDVPSGLDVDTGKAECAINATVTLALHAAKIGFFIEEGFKHVGLPQILPIGLGETAKPDCVLLEGYEVASLLPEISRTRHKYEAGHVVGIAGSKGMCGAALLSSISSLRSGAGIIHLIHQASLTPEISGSPWEIVRVPVETNWEEALALIEKADSCFIGPGLGKNPFSERAVETLLQSKKENVVFDADALNICAEKNHVIPKGSVITPHRGEMTRLLHSKVSFGTQFLDEVKAYSEQHGLYIVLKGAPTFIFAPKKPVTVVAVGDPGMATAGTGDVLTGLIAGFLAQKLSPFDACRLGAFVHGLAGIAAAREETSFCMTATSLLRFLPLAMQRLMS